MNQCKQSFVNFKNLISVSLILVAVVVNTFSASAQSISPGQSLGNELTIRSLPNLRDIGGYKTIHGDIVLKGKTYRSSSLNPLSTEDIEKLNTLGLKNDYDLRSPFEVEKRPDVLVTDTRYTEFDVLASAKNIVLPHTLIAGLLKNPAEESAKLGGAQGAEQVFINLYRDFVSLPSANEAYRNLFLSMSEASATPNIFHCTNGKDRTGWAAAALLTLLGVPKDKVYEDFLLSNDYLLPQHEKEMDFFESQGGDRGILVAFFGVKSAYLDAAFGEMHKRYGSIEEYFAKGLNINTEQQNRIKEMYLSYKLVD